MKRKVTKNYVSDLDLFLRNFDRQQLEPSASQREEILKNKRIAEQRDHSQTS